MNYLAHAFLAGDSPELLVGHMVADFVGPHEARAYPPGVRAGIVMHQRVDSFTDSHPLVALSKRRMPPPFRRYAGILVDVFYDHLLAVQWRRFSPAVPLERFSQRAYLILGENEPVLPPRLRRILPYMIEQDWLASYRRIAAIERALQGISRRLRRANPLPEAVSLLDTHYHELESDFLAFFPELVRFVRETGPGSPL